MANVRVVTKTGLVKSPKMVIKTSTKLRLVVPYAPRVVTVEQDGRLWLPSARPGKIEVLRNGGRKPKKIRMEFTLGSKDRKSIQSQLAAFTHVADANGTCTISYSWPEGGVWNLIEFSYEVTDRNSYNRACRATVNATFQQVAPEDKNSGPVKKKKTKKKPSTKDKNNKGGRKYTVKRGDTLWDLAVKYYGSGYKWRKIADANGVTDPRKLRIGKVLRIP